MVDGPTRQEQVDELNGRLKDQPYKLALVPIGDLVLLEKNARYMTQDTFGQLVSNIKRDGGLSSVPLCMKEGGKYRVLSGNHRVQAAKVAGLTEVLVMYTDRPLNRQEQIAIQLSHNALVGQDDMAILKDLYEELESVDLKQYAGLDDKALKSLESLNLAGLVPERLEFRTVQFLFLPTEADRLRACLKRASEALGADEVVAMRLDDFDRAVSDLAKAQMSYNVQNSALGMMLVLDVFERHQTDLAEGWGVSESNKRRSRVPLASVFGGDTVPVDVARTLKRAVDKMVARKEVEPEEAWRCLEQWATKYLEGE
jgi:ParB-like chromosome segregation protein Spo0J